MSDLVEMLRDPGIEVTRDEAAAEIERLRERMREAAKLNMELMEIRRNNEAEIERLNEGWEKANSELLAERFANIGKVHPCDDNTAANLASALADNEQLREENSTLSDSLAAKADRIDRLGETVVRLRETIEAMAIYNGTQLVEIERLRAANVRLQSSLAADPVDQSAEIERLRHELADAHGVAQACERRAELAEAEIIKLKS